MNHSTLTIPKSLQLVVGSWILFGALVVFLVWKPFRLDTQLRNLVFLVLILVPPGLALFSFMAAIRDFVTQSNRLVSVLSLLLSLAILVVYGYLLFGLRHI